MRGSEARKVEENNDRGELSTPIVCCAMRSRSRKRTCLKNKSNSSLNLTLPAITYGRDLGLPDGSGYELVREAKQRQPLKGIALSGFGAGGDVRRSIEAGFDYHLTKPVSFQELRSLLQKVAE